MIFLNVFIVFLLFVGCTKNIPTPQEREQNLFSLIEKENLTQYDIQTSTFNIFSLQTNLNNCKNKDIKIYIEGDGLSWLSRRTISDNPTPINPISLKLMNQDKSQCKVYLARPCQYTNSMMCDKKYWTSHRFSKEIISSYNESLDFIKKEYKNSSFTLIGYSGGGAIVTLLSATRSDIDSFVTIAGNLDIEKWTSMYNLSKLDGSLNPADYSKKLENIKQFHMIGSDDRIIPKDIFLSYFSKFDRKDKISFELFKSDHNCCWEEYYKEVLNRRK